MAVKLPFAEAGSKQVGKTYDGRHGEVNWVTTESMEAFPLADFDDLYSFAKSGRTACTLKGCCHMLRALCSVVCSMFLNRDTRLSAKTFYSQLPFALGPQACMKFEFEPLGELYGPII